MFDPQRAQGLARWLLPGVAIAALLSGSVFWLRRVGWLQAETYWYPHARLLEWFHEQPDPLAAQQVVLKFNSSLHDSSGWLWLAKLPKELIALAFLLLALVQFARPFFAKSTPSVRQPRAFTIAYTGLFALASATALAPALAGRWIDVVAGARSFVSWVLGAFGLQLASGALLRRLAEVCVWTLLVQAVLVAIEMKEGLLIYSMNFFGMDLVRAVGSFNLPISMGTFAVVAWAAAWCWGEFPRRTIALLTLLLLVLLIVNASGSAWAAFAAAGLVGALVSLPLRKRVVLLLCALPLSVLSWLALPHITGRPDIHDSLYGRIYPVHAYASRHLTASQIVFGSGFGRGTNAHSSLSEPSTTPIDPTATPVGDSMPAALLWQVGLLGLACAYALMLLALRTDPKSRPIGIAILVSSIAVNVTELFPVNIVLGFWLAHAARDRGADGHPG